MIEFQIVSPVEKDECVQILVKLANTLITFPMTYSLHQNHQKFKNEYLPEFERELNASYKATVNFKIFFPSLQKRLKRYEQYPTSVSVSFNPDLKSVWSYYCGDLEGGFLGVLIDDNQFSDKEKLTENELNLLYDGIKDVSSDVCRELKRLRKNYLCIDHKSGKLIEVCKIF